MTQQQQNFTTTAPTTAAAPSSPSLYDTLLHFGLSHEDAQQAAASLKDVRDREKAELVLREIFHSKTLTLRAALEGVNKWWDVQLRYWHQTTEAESNVTTAMTTPITAKKSNAAPFALTREPHCVMIPGHLDGITSLTFGAGDSRYLFSSGEQRIGVWLIPDGALLCWMHGHTHNICDIAVSPSTDFVASGATHAELMIWRVSTFTLDRALNDVHDHGRTVMKVCFDPTGEILASSNNIGEIVLNRVGDTWPVLRRIRTQIYFNELCFVVSDNGLRSVICMGLNALRSIDIESGQLMRTFEGHTSGVCGVAFSSRYGLFSVSYDNSLIRWDLRDGQVVHQMRNVCEGENKFLSYVSVFESLLACGSNHGKVRLWTLPEMTLVNVLVDYDDFVDVCFHPSGAWLVSGGADIKLWSAYG